MTEELDRFLAESLEDRRVSRAERKTLAAVVGDLGAAVGPSEVRRRAFEAARGPVGDAGGRAALDVLDWLEDVLKVAAGSEDAAAPIAEVHFSPGDDCRDRIIGLLANASEWVDVCVFTITDDRISDAIVAAHRRGVKFRIISDDDKAGDLGSDVDRFERSGIAVRVDRSPYHMHHKFAVFDGRVVLSGSYNWTRGAAADNEENVVVTGDPRLLGPFVREFEKLWKRLG